MSEEGAWQTDNNLSKGSLLLQGHEGRGPGGNMRGVAIGLLETHLQSLSPVVTVPTTITRSPWFSGEFYLLSSVPYLQYHLPSHPGCPSWRVLSRTALCPR